MGKPAGGVRIHLRAMLLLLVLAATLVACGETRLTLATIIDPPGSGSIEVNPVKSNFSQGETVDVTAIARPGWRFDRWEGDLQGRLNPEHLKMDSAKVIKAVFVELRYTLTLSTTGQGSVAQFPPPGPDGRYSRDTSVSLTAVPASGWSLKGWSGAASGTSRTVTVVVDSDKAATASFVEELRYTLTISTTGQGSVSQFPLPGPDGRYSRDTPVSLAATPASKWSFQGWSGAAYGTSPTVILVLNSDKAVTASFVELRYSLIINTAGQGSISQSPPPGPDGKYNHDTEVILTAVPASGSGFQGWSGAASGTSRTVTVVMDSDKAVIASFGESRCALTINTMGQGSVSRSLVPGPDGKYSRNATVTLTAEPATGWSLQGWSGAASGTSLTVMVFMDSDKVVWADFSMSPRTSQQIVLNMGGAIAGFSRYTLVFSSDLVEGDLVTGSVTWVSSYVSGWRLEIYDPEDKRISSWNGRDAVCQLGFSASKGGKYRILIINEGDATPPGGVLEISPSGWARSDY